MLIEIVKGGFKLSFSFIFITVLSLIYTPILARVLGPEGLGAMNLALLMIPWIIAFSSFALETTATKFMAEYKAKNQDISPLIRDYYFIGILSGSVTSFFYFLLSDTIAWHVFHDPRMGFYIKISSPLIFLTLLYTISLGILRGQKKFGMYALFEVFHQIFIVAIGIFLVLFLRFGVTGALIALIASPMILVLYNLYSFRGNFKKGGKEIGRIIRLGFWLMIVSVAFSFFPTFDRLFLGYLESTEVVGFYAAALNLTTATTFFSTAIRSSMYPYISESYAKGDMINTRRYLEGVLKYCLTVLGFFLIPSMALRKEIIILLFGTKFIQSILIFQVLLFATFFMTIFGVLNTFLVSSGETKRLLIPFSISMAVAIPIYLVLTSSLHAIGAAISLTFSFLFLSVCYWFISKKKIDFSIAQAVKLILVISCFLTLISFLTSNLRVNILIALVFTAFYVILLFLLKILTKEEIDFIHKRLE